MTGLLKQYVIFCLRIKTHVCTVDFCGAGIPVYAEAGRNGGIHLMNDFVLDKAVLSDEEKAGNSDSSTKKHKFYE